MTVLKSPKISIIGFGVMGRGIAQLIVQAGLEVVANDVDEGILQRGLVQIKSGPYGLEQAVSRGKLSKEAMEAATSKLHVTSNMEAACKNADFIIEAIQEDFQVKRTLLKQLDSFCSEATVLASNTSTLSITELAAGTKRPERVVGMHFFNPPQLMKLVEIIRGLNTSDGTLEQVKNLAKQLGKVPITVKDSPGFATSRLGIALFMEASDVLQEGVASIRDIDLAMRLGYGHPMGPFELVDLVGLDARLNNLEAMFKATGTQRWKPPLLLRQLVASGYIGDVKIKPNSKGGYYDFFSLEKPQSK